MDYNLQDLAMDAALLPMTGGIPASKIPVVSNILGGIGSSLGFGSSSSAKKKAKSSRAYQSAFNNANNYLSKQTQLGDDNSDLLNAYQQYLNDSYSGNNKYFYKTGEGNRFNQFVNKETQDRQNSMQNYFNNLYGGFGTTNSYLDNAWKMTADDDYNTDFLNKYYDDALSRLDAAQSRGLLNDAGYDTALDTLNTRRSGALGGLNELTDSVLQGYRDDLSSVATGQQAAIDSFDLSQRNQINSDAFQNQFNDVYSQQQSGLESSLNNATAGYVPFDVSDILGTARSTQGVISGAQNNDLLSSLKDKDKKGSGTIGLGNEGLF